MLFILYHDIKVKGFLQVRNKALYFIRRFQNQRGQCIVSFSKQELPYHTNQTVYKEDSEYHKDCQKKCCKCTGSPQLIIRHKLSQNMGACVFECKNRKNIRSQTVYEPGRNIDAFKNIKQQNHNGNIRNAVVPAK